MLCDGILYHIRGGERGDMSCHVISCDARDGREERRHVMSCHVMPGMGGERGEETCHDMTGMGG